MAQNKGEANLLCGQFSFQVASYYTSDDLPDNHAPASFLPPLQRRRLNDIARLAFETAHRATAGFPPMPMIVMSESGELRRSFDLWLQLIRGEGVSPASFALSVHNAVAGQWSLLNSNTCEQSALASESSTVESALMEAAAMLADGYSHVLVLWIENPVPNLSPNSVNKQRHAIALVIESGKGYTISLHIHKACDTTTSQVECCAIDWIDFMRSNAKVYSREQNGIIWEWEKHA